MLGAVPVEAFDVDEDDSLYDVGLIGGAKGFDEGGSLGVVFVDFDAAEDFETRLVRVVHEEEGYAGIVVEVAEADVLLVAAEVCEAEEPGIDDANEALGSAAVLDVGPAGFADRGHIEAIAAFDEVLFGRAEEVSLGCGLRNTLVLVAAAVLLLMFFDERREGEFLEATSP